jgi:antitoxin ParD1/3/4
MDTIDFSVPEQYRDFVQARVAAGGFATATQYLQRLIEDDQRRQLQIDLDAALLQGVESGPAVPMVSDDWESIRAEVRSRFETRARVS